jgi:NAD+ synthase
MSDLPIIAAAQINSTLGDLDANKEKILQHWKSAKENKADLLVTPELSLTGYPLDDLVHRPALLTAIENTIHSLATLTKKGVPLLVGTPWIIDNKLYNAALFINNGKIKQTFTKRALPQYGPFHEKRYFERGNEFRPLMLKDSKIGIAICEDMWDQNVVENITAANVDSIISINASPYEIDKEKVRFKLIQENAKEYGIPIAYVNTIGGQDELVFDGNSFAVDGKGEITQTLSVLEEDFRLIDLNKTSSDQGNNYLKDKELETLYEALVLSVRDYAMKNDFSSAIIGISGGIDSALTVAIACDALGADNVHALMLAHDKFTSDNSIKYAKATCVLNNCHFSADHEITAPFHSMKKELEKRWARAEVKETYENVQARLRTLFLFAVSNEENHLVLNTSNKTEVAMGHSTFYGDTSGGFAPLKDVWKLKVYELAKWRNNNQCRIGLNQTNPVIDTGIIERDPTPELGENETDKDLLPPYNVLDPVLKYLVEDELSVAEIEAKGFDKDIVTKIAYHLQKMQFKRFQTPPGPKVTKRSFGHRERMQISFSQENMNSKV